MLDVEGNKGRNALGYGMSPNMRDDQHALMQIKSKSRKFMPNSIHSRICTTTEVMMHDDLELHPVGTFL